MLHRQIKQSVSYTHLDVYKRQALYTFSKEEVEASKKEMEELMLLSLQSEKEASDLMAGLGVAPKVPQPRTTNTRQMAVTHQKEQQTLISEKEETERQGKANIESEKQGGCGNAL